MASNDGCQVNLRVCCCSLGIGCEVSKWLAEMGTRVIFEFVVVL